MVGPRRALYLARQPRLVTISRPSFRRSSAKAASAAEQPRPNIYKVFGRPFAKVFLGAMFTFQVLYWAWEQMRTDEIREEKLAEIASLEKEVQEYSTAKKA